MARVPRQGRKPGEFAETAAELEPGARAEECDAELTVRARAGDDAAFSVLYKRHVDSAQRVARLYAATAADAEDIASEGFTQILSALRAGGGPREAFRPYLLTAVRRIASRRAAGAKRDVPTPELESYTPQVPFEDPVLADLEASLVARAFAALPERWQAVLWHTAVEGESPAQVAEHLGLSANGVAALAFRAREGLRKEYLQAHLSAEKMERECRGCASQLAAYVRGSLSARAQGRVEAHLAECDRCPLLVPELREISGRLRGILAPLVLGPLFAGYFTSLADASPSETADDGAGEPAGPDDNAGLGQGMAGGGASSGATAAVASLAAVVVALAVAGAFLLPGGTASRPSAAGRTRVTEPSPTSTSTTASGTPEPGSSGPKRPLPAGPRPGDLGAGPGPTPAPGTSADDIPDVPSSSASSSASSAPSDEPGPVPPKPQLIGGAFETPKAANPRSTYGEGQVIGGWRVERSVNLVSPADWQAADGHQSLDLNGDVPAPASGAISQNFDTAPAQQYTVSFYLAGNPGCSHVPAVKTLTVQVAGVSKNFSFDTTGHSPSAMGWRPATVHFTATADRTKLRLASTTDPNSDCGPAIDEVEVTAGKAAH